MLKYIWISLVLLGGCFQIAIGQSDSTAVTVKKNKLPKTKYSYKPTAVRLGTNIFRLGRTAFDNKYTSWGFSGDIDFHKYLLEVSFGREANTLNTTSFDYKNSGSFFRMGPEINFIKDKTEANALVIGLKYVAVTYDEDFLFTAEDDIFGNNREVSLNNNNLNGRWLEANLGLKVKMWEQLYVGLYARYRFNRVVKGEREFGTYRIPAYGLEERRTVLGFDYYIFWRIPFKKSPKLEE